MKLSIALLLILPFAGFSQEDFSSKSYYYVTEGDQVKVYRSSDFKYVLKRIMPPKKGNHSSFKGLLKRAQKNLQNEIEAHQSYYAAAHTLAKETGVVTAHLFPGGTFANRAWLVDERKGPRHLDLAKSAFIIQAYAEPMQEALSECLTRGKKEEALHMIDQALCVADSLITKGYVMQDPNFLKNWGWCDNRALILDVGQFKPLSKEHSDKQVAALFEKARFKLTLAFPALADEIEALFLAHSTLHLRNGDVR